MPGYTRIPNEFLDTLAPTLSEVELRLLLAIFRQTLGWQRGEAPLSLSQLQRATGLTNRTHMIRTLRQLEAKHLIRTRPQFTADGRPSATLYEVVPAGYLVPVGDGVSAEDAVSPGYGVSAGHPVSPGYPVPVEDQKSVPARYPTKKEKKEGRVTSEDEAVWDTAKEALRAQMSARNWELRLGDVRLVRVAGDLWYLQTGTHANHAELHGRWGRLIERALSSAVGHAVKLRFVPPGQAATG